MTYRDKIKESLMNETLEEAMDIVTGICFAAMGKVLTEYLSDELANALMGEIALEIAKAAKEINEDGDKNGQI